MSATKVKNGSSNGLGLTPGMTNQKNHMYTQGVNTNYYDELIHTSKKKITKINDFLDEYEGGAREVEPERIKEPERQILEGILQEPDPDPCACEVCTCHLHPCPIRKVPCKYPHPPKTVYQQDFVPQAFDPDALGCYNPNKAPRAEPKHPLDKDTRYKLDYVEHPLEGAPPREFAKRPATAVPFAGNTNYRKDYVDWGIPSVPPAVVVNTKPKVPFEGTTNYADSYIPHDPNSRAKPMRKVDAAKPERKFDGVTSKMIDYKPFKINPAASEKKAKPVVAVPAYPGQYLSTAKKDFAGKRPTKECVVNHWPQLPIFGSTSGYYHTLNKLYCKSN